MRDDFKREGTVMAGYRKTTLKMVNNHKTKVKPMFTYVTRGRAGAYVKKRDKAQRPVPHHGCETN